MEGKLGARVEKIPRLFVETMATVKHMIGLR